MKVFQRTSFVTVLLLLSCLLLSPLLRADTVLVPAGASWKYHDKGINLGTAWKELSFDDSSWTNGIAELGYGDGDEATLVSFGADANNKYLTTYFRKSFTVSEASQFGALTLTLTYDDGAVVYLNGTEVYRINMPDGAPLFSTAATAAADYTPAVVSIPATNLISGDNVVAVEMHQGNVTSSDLSMNLSLSANLKPTVALTSPADGTAFSAPVNINLTASASDPDGTVARVDYYSGTTLVASGTGAPFAATWTNVAEGVYSLTAVAVDNTGGTGTSSPINVSVTDTNPPALAQVLGVVNQVTITFSKRVQAGATNAANYTINNGVTVLSATYGASSNIVVLNTTTIGEGSTYTLTVNNVQDLGGRTIAPNSQIQFVLSTLITANLGNPAIGGTFTNIGADGFNIGGAGTDISGTADQFTFAYEQKIGDFDLRVRVADLGITDPYAKAALMARESVGSNSVFAASVVTPSSMAGCFFQARATTGGTATSSGGFPANFPETWLRLKRAGNAFTGYASVDGQRWVLLGSSTLTVGAVNVGFAVTSHNPSQRTVAQFRSYGAAGTNAQVVSNIKFSSEPLAAIARTGPIVISEIMFNSESGTNVDRLEFVELYNSNPFFEDISGYRLSGSIDYTFPAGTIMPGGTFLVVAKDPAYLQSVYGLSGVLGPFTNSLPKSGTIRLRNDVNAINLEVNYSNENPWPAGADGTGHSLVVTRASYGQDDPQAWDISYSRGGSPGRHELMRTATGLNAVVINEFLAGSVAPTLDFVELYNHGNTPVDISGCWLSDEAGTNLFQISANTILPAGGFISFNETQMGFSLNSSGETIYFRSPDTTHTIQAVRFEAQEPDVSSGRYPNGANDFFRLSTRTPGTANTPMRLDDIVINEIMFGPISENRDDQYVELYNQGTNTVDLSGWQFTAGIDFKFPPTASIAPNSYVVVARNTDRLLSNYPQLNSTNTFGDFGGSLSRGGERLALARPVSIISTNTNNVVVTNINQVVVDEVSYKAGGRWGRWANQGGSSLELIHPRSNHRMAFSWADSDETAKAPWTPFEHTGRLDQGSTYAGGAIDRLEVTMLGEGEMLLDDVSITTNAAAGLGLGLTNPGFETGQSPWVAQGNHVFTGIASNGYTGTRSLHLRATGNGDTGGNRVRVAIPGGLVANQSNVKLRGYIRWQRGWPEMIMRLKGNYLEAYGRAIVPSNLGSPGLPNSRSATNSPPGIADVTHYPVLPAANESVVITARLHDPDGLSNASVFYRVDPSTGFTQLAMNDTGLNGDLVANDGIYSATIPGQIATAMVAFYVQATDAFGARSQLPENAATANREAMIRWGDPSIVSSFAVYRMWISQVNINTYTGRPAVSNQDVDSTMVIGNYRVIYNMGARYGGSPYHQGQNSSPVTGSVHYQASVPEDDRFLGTTSFNKLHAPGNGAFDDASIMREQISFWLVRKLGLPYLYRRYFTMFVNGNRKGGANQLMEDSQRPGGEMIDQWYPDENSGRLFKEQPWFEWDDVNVTGGGAAGFENKRWCQLTPFYSTNNLQKTAAYRYTWLARSADQTANDYSDIFALTTVASLPTTSPTYWPSFEALIDVDQWAKTFAVEHAVGNWDSFGSQNAQNLYGYKPKNGKWKQFIWDYNIVLGNSGSWTPGQNLFNSNASDASMVAMNSYPPFRRAWLRAYKDLAVGPNAPMANAGPVVDARSAAFAANGIVPGVAGTVVKQWVLDARAAIASTVAAADVANFTVGTPNVTATSNLVTISGSAPVDVTDLFFNGVRYPITWTTVTSWSVKIPVTNNTQIAVAAFNSAGQQFGVTNNVAVTYTNALVNPAGFIVFNEIMYNPLQPLGAYVELFNTHSNFTFDLSGWRINGLNYTFPPGSFILPRQYLILANNRVNFAVRYGAAIPIFDEFTGSLQNEGETLTLLRPAIIPGGPEVVVDRVRYESALPWSPAADGTGSSLQLLDPSQDNARVGNWFASYIPPVFSGEISTPARINDGWRFVSVSGSAGPGIGGGQMRLVIYLGPELGSAIVDDVSVVAGTNAAAGLNFVRNGDFESSPLLEPVPLTNSWQVGTNYTNTAIIGSLTHGGGGALRVQASLFANSYPRLIAQNLSPAPPVNTTNTLSFWYWATNSATNLSVRLFNSSALNVTTNLNITFTPSNYVPPQLVSPATNTLSPGTANQQVTNLPAFPPLWINELQARNLSTGPLDNQGQRDPWLELHNPSTNHVSLEGLFLAGTYTNLTEWAFPAGATIAPGQFLVLYCDGEPAQTAGSEYHTSFRLAAASGSVALSRLYNGQPQVLDYVNYAGLHGDRSFGSHPDGQPFDRQEFFYVTPGAANDGRSAPLVVFINEWMAANLTGLTDPADGDFDDWFELYNPGTNTVDLAGYYLTDTLTNQFKYLITTNGPHLIPPGGHLLVWADNETGQNTALGVPRTDLHVNFQLATLGEAIGLFAADGTQIDAVTFGPQTGDLSEGRYPDGGANLVAMPGTASPRAANHLAGTGNTPPLLDPVGPRTLYLGDTLAFTATAHDADLPAQILAYSLDAGAPAGAAVAANTGAFTWTPAVAGQYSLTLRVTDNGVPPASASETLGVTVLGGPALTSPRRNGNNLELNWGTLPGRRYALDHKADLNAPAWTPLATNLAAGTSLAFTNAPAGTQGFYRLRLVQ